MLYGKGRYFYLPFQKESPVCSNIGDFFCSFGKGSRVNRVTGKAREQAAREMDSRLPRRKRM